MKPRQCDDCGADMEQNHLRATDCLDGRFRRLCEYCAIDREDEKKAANWTRWTMAQGQRKAAS